MKKSLFAILAFAGLAQVSFADAYYTKNDFDASSGSLNLLDVASTFSSGTFAVSFELDKSLTDISSVNNFFTFILGGLLGGSESSFRVDIVCMGPQAMSMGVAGSAGTFPGGFTLSVPQTSGPFVLQVVDGDATLSYCENGELNDIMTVVTDCVIPEVINEATLTFDETTASNITTWIGVVTADDLANPTPAPSVPEPTTATLSLLALAGLAARRRRR